MKYIIDTDPGIDDAIAIMMAHRNNLDIIGFTLSSGNIPLEKCINNLMVIEDFMETNIPIYKGTIINEANPETAEYAHGKDGLGYAVFPKNKHRQVEKMSAEDFIIKSSKKYQDLMLVCLGPLTNLANAIRKDPELPKRLKKIVVMSATYNPDSKDIYKEFNIRVDPKAAELVYNSPFEEIKAITHEVGLLSYIEKDYIVNLRNSNDLISRFVSNISEKYMDFSFERHGINGIETPDPTTIASIIDPSIITFEPFDIKIAVDGPQKGECYATPNEKSHIFLSTDFDLEKFRELFKKTFH